MVSSPSLRCFPPTLLVALLLLAGCRPVQKVINIGHELPPVRSSDRVVEQVLAHLPGPTRYYTAKAEVRVSSEDGQRSFKANIRSVHDSALWVSVVPALGIEVARALVTADSIKLLDRLHDRYFTGNAADAEARFGLTPDLQLAQAALFGLPVGLDPEEKYRVDREEGAYVLVSREKRRFIRAAENIAQPDSLTDTRDMGEKRLERTLRRAEEREAIVFRYWVDPITWKTQRVTITDLARDQQADVRYTDHGVDDGPPYPHSISLSLSDGTRHASGSLKLSRIDLEGPLQLGFRIPEKFVPME
ncbi:MAG: DUF4292 domain-containing protein [Flavobacteriales bacterium]|nr:DUF4292 domain-containing protein [Flavobacteriales bacterium]MCB9167097.1 DUF4292 domain-containing protein [Flavobacteriales bacterium]